MLTSPMLELQKQKGASIEEAHGWYLPSTYTSLANEYKVATERVGLLDRSYVGRLKVRGRDGSDLLNRLSTNNLDDLVVSSGMYTVLTSNKGRIIDLLFVLLMDGHLMVLTSPESRQRVIEWIDFYTFSEDVIIDDQTEETPMLALVGPNAASLLDRLTDQDVSSLSRHYSMQTHIVGVDVTIIRTDFANIPGYDLIISAHHAPYIWEELLHKGETEGIQPVGLQTLELVRIENGVPSFGKELGEKFNPLEAGLLEFVSFNKGCYIGQEVVTRLNTYMKVQKHLVGLSWEPTYVPASNTDLFHLGTKVGQITSAATSMRLNKGIGLGYVKGDQAQPGIQLTMLSSVGEISVRVEELPFRISIPNIG